MSITVLRLITYTNTSDNPPASVVIDFTFSDGNGQPGGQNQGAGASPGTATGSVTVEITQVDDAPVLVNVAPAAAYGIGTRRHVVVACAWRIRRGCDAPVAADRSQQRDDIDRETASSRPTSCSSI